MKAAVFHGPRDVTVEEIETPELLPGDVLIRIKACGICGSDLHTYKHGMFAEQLGAPVETGCVLGHEFSGEVAEINGEVKGLKVGDRVTCVSNGGNAEYLRMAAVTVPTILHLPPEVSYEEAATNEPLATSLHAVRLAEPQDGETAVVIGAGIIGLGVVQVLKALTDPKTILAVDLSEKRLAMAQQVGADVLINAGDEDPFRKVLELAGSREGGALAGAADMVFDCAGVSREGAGPNSLQQAVMMAKENGRVVIVSVSERPFDIEANIIMRKGLKLLGSWSWNQDELAQALDLMRTGKVERKQLVSHEFSLDQASEAYETQVNVEEAIKVLIKP